MRNAIILAILLFPSLLFAQPRPDPNIASTNPRSPADEQKALRLPPGFTIQLVAAEPDIHKPLNMNFDDRGRLWVTDTVEYPFPAAPGKKPRDTVKILDDFGPDGRARKITTFADGLNIPIGVVPLSNVKTTEAIVYSIPNVLRLRDTKGTGKADQRDVLFGKFGAADTHGMTNAFTRGFDGWIYATHGYSNTSTVKAGDGPPITMQSGNTYRFRPDGSKVEQWTWGQVNPFGLAFDPLGNLYSCDCHSQPIYQLLRGAYYPSFGKPHDGLGFAPTMFEHYTESTAIAGIVYYAADHFPKSYLDCAFVGDVVTNRINLFRIKFLGSTPKATLERFLQSDDPWFRPVDIKLGPDGAIYVADFYNRIIGHYEVPLDHPGRDRERGRIWRIVYTGTDGKTKLPPLRDWTKATVNELVAALGHPNLTVRLTAANQLVERGGEEGINAVKRAILAAKVLEGLREEDRPGRDWLYAHALWVLERAGALDFRKLAAASRDSAVVVRVHAYRIFAERKRWDAEYSFLSLTEGTSDSSPQVIRAAVDALARHSGSISPNAFWMLARRTPADDTHLRHVLRMALRDLLREAAGEDWPDYFLHLDAPDGAMVAEVALGVPSPQAAAFLLKYIPQHASEQSLLFRWIQHIARYAAPDKLSDLWSFVRSHHPENLHLQADLFRAVERGTQARGAQLDESVRTWASGITTKLLASKQAADVQTGIEFVGALQLKSEEPRLVNLASTKKTPEKQRTAAITALMALDAPKHAAVLGKILVDVDSPIKLRESASGLLAKANKPEAFEQLVKAFASVPAKLQKTIAADLAASPAGAKILLDTIAAGKASARLLQERAVEVRLTNSKLPNVKERVAQLTKGLPPANQQIAELMRRRHDGFGAAKHDATAGAKIFEKSCAICHQLGGKGAKIGPQLDGVGIRGLDRLLEDVLDPNRNVDQAFRLTTLNLKNGQVVNGLVLREEGAVIVVANEEGKEVRVEKAAVEERTVSQQSPMPANFADQIPEPEFYHLMAFLLAQKDAPPRPH